MAKKPTPPPSKGGIVSRIKGIQVGPAPPVPGARLKKPKAGK